MAIAVHQLSQDQLEGLKARQELLSIINFGPAAAVLQEKGFTEAEIRDNLAAFQQWFALIPCVPPGEVFVMLKSSVDEVFHACVLNTRLYRILCGHGLGEFLDHTPIDDETVQQLEAGVEYSINFLEMTYGPELHPLLVAWRGEMEAGTAQMSCYICGKTPEGSTVVGHRANGAKIVH